MKPWHYGLLAVALCFLAFDVAGGRGRTAVLAGIEVDPLPAIHGLLYVGLWFAVVIAIPIAALTGLFMWIVQLARRDSSSADPPGRRHRA